jgi:hypothetical protein
LQISTGFGIVYVTSLFNITLFSFTDALKEISEVNPKILQEKVNFCAAKFRNVEGCRELMRYTESLQENSYHSVNESHSTETIA